jgi:transposase
LSETETMSAKEVAREFGVDARTFRKFMRAVLPKEDQPGQGNRYQIETKQLKKLRKLFDEWHSPKPSKAAENGEAPAKPKKSKKKKSKEPEVADLTEEASDEVIDDLDLLDGPIDDELEEIEFDG